MTTQQRFRLKTQLAKRNNITSRMASLQLGQEIKQTAKRNGMTVSRLAKAAGIPNTSVVNYLYGTCLMSLDAYVTLWEQAQKKR